MTAPVAREGRKKLSGLRWAHSTPNHWSVAPLKGLTDGSRQSFTDGDWIESPYITDTGVRYLTTGHVGLGVFKDKGESFISQESFRELGCTEVLPGDILIARLNSPIARACIVPDLGGPIVTSVDNVIFRPRPEIDRRFIVYAMSHPGFSEHAALFARGSTMLRIARSALGRLPLILPPPEEQRAIASFLDRETEKIDTLVEKKRRLLKLLEEKRTALITRAVTRGLDPDVPMKDSRVEWLGEIPEHWEVVPIYAKYDVQLGKMLDSKTISGDHLAPYLRNQDVQWGRVVTDDLPRMDFGPQDRKKYALKIGDLLVCEGGDVGRSAIWEGQLEECFFQKALHRVRGKNGGWPRFLLFVMRAASEQGVFEAGGNPNTILHLTATMLRHYRVPHPPIEEQERIAGFLAEEEARFAEIRDRMTDAISLLQEYRTALISAAVTGKIDVRDKVPA